MRQDRNDAELMSITGTLQNILTNYLDESNRESITVRLGSSVVTALPSNSLITPSYKVISTETTRHKSLQVSPTSLVPSTRVIYKEFTKSSVEPCSNRKLSSTK